MRDSEYGALGYMRNSGSLSKDDENERIIKRLIENERREIEKKNLKNSTFPAISTFAYPFLGAAVAVIFNRFFLLPKSYYLKNFNIGLVALFGYKFQNSLGQNKAYRLLLNQIGNGEISPELALALENNDSRYAHKLREDVNKLKQEKSQQA